MNAVVPRTPAVENLYTDCRPVRRKQLPAGFTWDYESAVTGDSFMEVRGEGFLNPVRDGLRLPGRPEPEQIGSARKLTIYPARYTEGWMAAATPPSPRPGKP